MPARLARLSHAPFACALISCAALLPCTHADDAPNEASFTVSAEHTAVPVTEAPRAGWIERRDTLRFGGFGLSVVQRINPQTGLPAQEGTRWGDAFVGVIGHKPETYMASNWSPWDFLNVHVRLQGDAIDIVHWADTQHLADLPAQPVYDQTRLLAVEGVTGVMGDTGAQSAKGVTRP